MVMTGRVLLIGGSGFLGRGIIRKAQRQRWPVEFTVYSRDEHKLHRLRNMYQGVSTVIGDCRDQPRLEAVMSGHDTVIHCAALKHIPEAERDVSQAVAVNIEGSIAVARAALNSRVRNVVGISTDKACSPRNTYGATKMLMERVFQEYDRLSTHARFTCVRYGNVVSSTGSVIPLFLQQISENDRVDITALDMTRFWISIDDAIGLIELALSTSSRGGSIFVHRCSAMRILDVAQAAWFMAGRPNVVEHRVIGTRPGEKLHETLVDSYEAPFAEQYHNRPDVVVIPPALSLKGEGTHDVMPYSSMMPDSWMSQGEMVELIQDADRV